MPKFAKKIHINFNSDVSSPAARSKNGKTLTRSSRLEEEDFVTNDLAMNHPPDPGLG